MSLETLLLPYSQICALILGLSLSIPAGLSATPNDPLSELEQRLSSHTNAEHRSQRRRQSDWFDSDTNFGSLFLSPTGAKQLLDWSGELSTMTLRSSHTAQRPEFVEAIAEYQSALNSKVVLHILVPHPKFEDSVQAGLIPQFRHADRSSSTPQKKEERPVRSFTATLHTTADEEKSLAIWLPHSAQISITGSKEVSISQLMKIAETLDLERLEHKLKT